MTKATNPPLRLLKDHRLLVFAKGDVESQEDRVAAQNDEGHATLVDWDVDVSIERCGDPPPGQYLDSDVLDARVECAASP